MLSGNPTRVARKPMAMCSSTSMMPSHDPQGRELVPAQLTVAAQTVSVARAYGCVFDDCGAPYRSVIIFFHAGEYI